MHTSDGRGTPQPDPTKMANQPALQKSSGTIWVVMGGLFLIASLISFGAVIVGGGGQATPLAVTISIAVIVLYLALLVTRFVVKRKPQRLRIMAGCMLSMAFLSLVGIWVCAMIENAAA